MSALITLTAQYSMPAPHCSVLYSFSCQSLCSVHALRSSVQYHVEVGMETSHMIN